MRTELFALAAFYTVAVAAFPSVFDVKSKARLIQRSDSSAIRPFA